MGDWFKRVTATAAGRLLAWLVVSAVTTTGLGLSLASSWQYLKAAPQPILILSLAGVLLSAIFVVFFAWAFLCTQIHDGTFGSKYLLWYKLPIRKVSWSFDQFLGAGSGQRLPVLIYAFQPQLKVNWGDGIHPKKAFIECRTTGALQTAIAEMPGQKKVHFLNDNAVRLNKSLGDAVGLKNIGVHVITVQPGHFSTEFHVHLFEEECIYVLSGHGTATIGKEAHSIGPGDFIGCPLNGVAHCMKAEGSEPLVCLVVGQRLAQDVTDYPNLKKRLYRNNGEWNVVDHSNIQHIKR